MEQKPFPFHETAEDATSSAIIRSGKSFKEVAHETWPSMPIDTAYARLKNCLRHDAREKLLADEHVFIANLVGEFDFLFYVAQKCHHTQPNPVEPEDEKAQLYREVISAVKRSEQLAQRLGDLIQSEGARPKRPAILRGVSDE